MRYRGDVDRLKVCVIGAGMSGLITIKELLDENQWVVCYEAQALEGGVFNLHDRVSNTAYDSLLLTVSNYAMAFSCFPPQEHEERRFWTVKEYQRYLRRFTDHYQLRDYIRFNSRVQRIERWKDRLWRVTVDSGGQERSEVFDAVAICSGAFQRPKFPDLPFADRGGSPIEVLHAMDYRSAEPFVDKRVLCVGMGESGADIVHEIATTAASTMLSVRESPPPLIPRYDCEHIGPMPNDAETTAHRYGVFHNQFRSRYNRTRHGRWRRAAERALSRMQAQHRAHERPPSDMQRYAEIARFIAHWNRRSYAGGLPFVSRFLTKNTVFVRDVIEGRLAVNFSQLRAIRGRTCVFRDGTRFEADVIMCCTGYEERHSPLFQADPELRRTLGGALNPREWFKHSIHPRIGKSLALIGFARPTQGMLPACAELQARYFALLCSNRRQLPDDIAARTQAENQAEEEMLKGDANIKTLVQYPYFSEGMAELIGCKPSWRTQLRDPVLAYKLFFGSMVSSRFRLDGPHRDPRTAKAVIKKLRVADTVSSQLTLGLLNLRPIYETVAFCAEALDKLKPQRKPPSDAADLGFQAWGPGQLRIDARDEATGAGEDDVEGAVQDGRGSRLASKGVLTKLRKLPSERVQQHGRVRRPQRPAALTARPPARETRRAVGSDAGE